MANKCLALVMHGGAGVFVQGDYTGEIAHMQGLMEAGRDALRAGRSALDVVVEAVAAMEAAGAEAAAECLICPG